MYKDMKKHQEYTNTYINQNYDRFNINMPKGAKEQLQNHAKRYGDKSVNALIVRAVREQIKQDGGDVSAWDALAPERDTQEVNADA